MEATITGLTAEKAEILYTHPALNGLAVEIELADTPGPLRGSAQVRVSADGLAKLAELPTDYDGHFDGRYVWIDGTEYTVRGL